LSAVVRRGRRDTVLTVIFGGLLLIAVIATFLVSTVFSAEEKYTEFYLLDANGKLDNFPTELAAGQSGTVLVNIVNHESVAADYRIEVAFNSEVIQRLDDITVADGDTWRTPVNFKAAGIGADQRLRLTLYNSAGAVYRGPLYLTVNVSP